MNDTPDIILFGGTFDPPHAGHQNCVQLAQREFPSARILVAPAPAPASAGYARKTPHLAFAERVELCRLAFGQSGPSVEISDIESTLPAPNYTVNTIAALADQHPGKSLGLLIGMDQFAQFLSWKEPLQIAARAHLLVVGREEEAQAARTTFEQHLADLRDANASSLPALTIRKVYFLPGLTSAASSTTLRETLATGKEAPKGWLAPSVEAYIKKENIYSGDHPS